MSFSVRSIEPWGEGLLVDAQDRRLPRINSKFKPTEIRNPAAAIFWLPRDLCRFFVNSALSVVCVLNGFFRLAEALFHGPDREVCLLLVNQ